MSNRVLLGKIDNSDYGLIISKEGVDVTSATDDQLIFDSRSKGYGQAIFKESITLTAGTAVTRTFSSVDIPNPAIVILGEEFVQVSNITGKQATFLAPTNFGSFITLFSGSQFFTSTVGKSAPSSVTITYLVFRGHI